MPDFSNPFVLGITITEYFAFALLCLINWNLYKKYKERHNVVARLLLLAFVFFSLGPVLQSQDTLYGDTLTILYMGYIASFGYSSAMVCAGIANFFMLQFANILFYETPDKKKNIIGVLDVLIVVLFFIFKSLNLGLVSTIILGLHILVSFIILGFIFTKCLNIARKIDNLLEKRSFQFIGFMGFFLIAMYICFIIEALFFYGTYSLFGMLGWIFGLLGTILAYFGFCRPAWFVKKYTR